MIDAWVNNNRAATAFILGVIVSMGYLMFTLLVSQEKQERREDRHETPAAAEVKHDRRNAA